MFKKLLNLDLDNILGREKVPTKYSGLNSEYVLEENYWDKWSEEEKKEFLYFTEILRVREGAILGMVIGGIIGFILGIIYFAFKLKFG